MADGKFFNEQEFRQDPWDGNQDDERGLPNQENSKRMAAAYPQGLANFTQMLSERKTDAYDYLLMLGDMVSFPTAKGVETVMELAGKTGLTGRNCSSAALPSFLARFCI